MPRAACSIVRWHLGADARPVDVGVGVGVGGGRVGYRMNLCRADQIRSVQFSSVQFSSAQLRMDGRMDDEIFVPRKSLLRSMSKVNTGAYREYILPYSQSD